MKRAQSRLLNPDWRAAMTTEEMIIHIFCIVDDRMDGIMKHSQAKLYPSQQVSIRILFALKGSTFLGFYRLLKCDYDGRLGSLPERTLLHRALAVHEDWTNRVLSVPAFSPSPTAIRLN